MKRDGNFHVINFDAAVDYGGVLMTDPGLASDLITKKMLLLRMIRGGRNRGPVSASNVAHFAERFDWFVRWRLSLGVKRNGDLRAHHLKDFKRRLADVDLLNLLPMEERLRRLFSEFRSGARPMPFLEGAGSRLGITAIATLLGVTAKALGKSTIRLPLVDFAEIEGATVSGYSSITTEKRRARFDGDWVEPLRGVSSARQYLTIWEALRSPLPLPDRICFDPFPGTTARVEAALFFKPPGRTATLAPDRFLRVLDEAARWVIDWGPFIVRAHQSLLAKTIAGALPEQAGAALPIFAGSDAHPLPAKIPLFLLTWRGELFRKSLNEWAGGVVALLEPARMLVTACAILVAGFSARRAGEVRSVRIGCLTDTRGPWELSTYIGKTLRDVDSIPVPATMRLVVELLSALSARTREHQGSEWLFDIAWTASAAVGRRKLGQFDNDALWDFAVSTGLETVESASKEPLLPHQLRKAFAVAFYHGYRYGSLDALSRFLRHFDPEITRIYVNDVLPGSMGQLREELRSRMARTGALGTVEDRKAIADRKALLTALVRRGTDFEAVRQGAFELRLLEMIDRTEVPVGHGAARLRRSLDGMRSVAEARVRLKPGGNDPDLLREPLVAQIREFVRTHYLEPVPGRVAHCTCTPGDADHLAAAKCLIERAHLPVPWREESCRDVPTRPDYTYSGTYACLCCRHAVLFSENEVVVSRVVASAEARAKSAYDPAGSVAAHASAMRAALDEAMSA